MTRDAPLAALLARHTRRLALSPEARGPALFGAGVDGAASVLEAVAADAELCAHLRQLPPATILNLLAAELRQSARWPS